MSDRKEKSIEVSNHEGEVILDVGELAIALPPIQARLLAASLVRHAEVCEQPQEQPL